MDQQAPVASLHAAGCVAVLEPSISDEALLDALAALVERRREVPSEEAERGVQDLLFLTHTD